ncbi:MAG: hypothetical protein LAP21_23650 [Acidobacteriia bacterium]|nr:hypothetical protein [Terriglobia bacterium]
MGTDNDTQRIWDAYKVLIDTRNLEINLFWQRSNYFLVLNTGLAIGFFNVKEFPYRLAMAIFGIVASILWLRVSLGAKHWQARWEQRLRDFEKECFPRFEFFSAGPERIEDDAKKGLGFFESKSYWFKNLAYKWALRKPSVTFSMIMLAEMFALGWLVLVGISVYLRNCS